MKSSSRLLLAYLSLLNVSTFARAASKIICNQKGWDAGMESYRSIDYTNSYEYCAGICQQDSTCKSFAYFLGERPDTGGDCELYNIPLQNNFVSDDSSPFTFYDKDCGAQLQQCNVAGYSKVDSWITFGASDIEECLWRCDNYGNGCVSYAFGIRQCLLYTELVATNVIADPTSPYVFNDHTCGKSSSTTTTTTTAKETTTKIQGGTSTTKSASTGLTTSTRISSLRTSTVSHKSSSTVSPATSSKSTSSSKSSTTTTNKASPVTTTTKSTSINVTTSMPTSTTTLKSTSSITTKTTKNSKVVPTTTITCG